MTINKKYINHFIKSTEVAAYGASLFVGKGDKFGADQAAVDRMRNQLNSIDMNGRIVIGEGELDEAPMLYIGEKVGKGTGENLDIAVDPVEGTNFVSKNLPNAISVLAAAAEKKCSLSSIFSELPPRFSKAGLLDNVSPEVSLRILHRFTAGDHRTISLELETYFTRELGFGTVDKIDVTDGLRIRFANGDIAHVRPSGNAPQLRIYAVADSQSRAEAIVEHAVRAPDGILRRLTARSIGSSEV